MAFKITCLVLAMAVACYGFPKEYNNSNQLVNIGQDYKEAEGGEQNSALQASAGTNLVFKRGYDYFDQFGNIGEVNKGDLPTAKTSEKSSVSDTGAVSQGSRKGFDYFDLLGNIAEGKKGDLPEAKGSKAGYASQTYASDALSQAKNNVNVKPGSSHGTDVTNSSVSSESIESNEVST